MLTHVNGLPNLNNHCCCATCLMVLLTNARWEEMTVEAYLRSRERHWSEEQISEMLQVLAEHVLESACGRASISDSP